MQQCEVKTLQRFNLAMKTSWGNIIVTPNLDRVVDIYIHSVICSSLPSTWGTSRCVACYTAKYKHYRSRSKGSVTNLITVLCQVTSAAV